MSKNLNELSGYELRNRKVARRRSNSLPNYNISDTISLNSSSSMDSDSNKSNSDSIHSDSFHSDDEFIVEKDENKIETVAAISSEPSSSKSLKNHKIVAITSKTVNNPENKPIKISESSENKMDSASSDYVLKFIPVMRNKDDLHKFCKCSDRIWKSIIDTSKPDQIDLKKQQCIDIIISKLEGCAYDVVRYIDFVDWPTLKTALEAKFLKRRSKGAISAELISVVQAGTDVLTFANKVEKLLGELNETCISTHGAASAKLIMELNECTALNSFQDGLREPFRTIIKAHHFKNLSPAIAQALEEEVSHKPSTSKSKNYLRSCSFCKLKGHDISECFKKRDQLKYNNNSDNNVTSQNQRQFYNSASKSYGQNKSHNNSNSYSNNRSYPANSNSNINRAELFCNYCKENHHDLPNCWKRKYNNLRNAYLNSNSNSTSSNNSSSTPIMDNSENLQRTHQNLSTAVRVQDLSAGK